MDTATLTLNVNGKRPMPSPTSQQRDMYTSTHNSHTSTNNHHNDDNDDDDIDDQEPPQLLLPPLPRRDKNGEPMSEKRLRRLEKNRLSARECRRRKREATEQIQHQINMLESENLRLRLQLQVGEEAEESNQAEQQRLTLGLDNLLKSGASESEIGVKIEEYKEKFADYGRDRRSAIEFHLRNIERLLMPTQTTSIILTTLNHGGVANGANTLTDANAASGEPNQQQTTTLNGAAVPTALTANSNSGQQGAAASTTTGATTLSTAPSQSTDLNAKSLFKHLVTVLDLTPEQAMALKDSRFVAKEMDECLKSSLSVLKEMRERLAQCGEDLETEFNGIRRILTPTQAAKFLVWVANNKACMHMLNELWNRVYPAQGRPSNASSSNGDAFGDDGDGADSGTDSDKSSTPTSKVSTTTTTTTSKQLH